MIAFGMKLHAYDDLSSFVTRNRIEDRDCEIKDLQKVALRICIS